MSDVSSQESIFEIVSPVLAGMESGQLKDALLDAFAAERESLARIEKAFRTLTERAHPPQALRVFFASWSKTNHSAASVSGLANRITLLARTDEGSPASRRLHDACSSLQRITDEDLGALGGMLHADLFYSMATTACGDDAWLLKSNCLPSAHQFKDWTDRLRLRTRDLTEGLFTTLVHEVYTHGEVEFIHEPFKTWFARHIDVPADRLRRTVAWVTVHTGGTESGHFGHAVDAVRAYGDAMQIQVERTAATPLFRQYLRRKAAVMDDCMRTLKSWSMPG